MENTKNKGNITEIETILAFMKLGYNVLIPYGDCERYDLVADVNGTFLKIQCKTASPQDKDGGSYKFSCRSTHRVDGKLKMEKYEKEEIDYFATCINGKCYLVPIEECGTDKVLRFSPPKKNFLKNINFAKDYEIQEVLKKYKSEKQD